MSLFAIGDTHLSFGVNKPMDVFQGWSGYERRLENNWNRIVSPEDTVVIAGDVSWAMTMEEALPDFRFLDSLNGTKIILKGNHDYWWATKSKTEKFLSENGIGTVKLLFNNAYRCGDLALCGTRGWFFDCQKSEDRKVLLREAGRLRLSLDAAEKLGGEPVIFLHYPPLSLEQTCDELYGEVVASGAKQCFYGHLHGKSSGYAFNGVKDGVDFRLISADYLEFCPRLIKKY